MADNESHFLARSTEKLSRFADASFLFLASAIALIVFYPGMRAGFVSDSWGFLEHARFSDLSLQLAQFVPAPDNWYRPLNELVFWIEYQAFALDPQGYHWVAWFCHLGSSFAVYLLSLRLLGSRALAATAGLAFLVSIHAHEILYDVGDLHNALGGLFLISSVYALARGSRLAAVGLAILNLLVDETGVLALALLALYELTWCERATRDVIRKVAAMILALGTVGFLYGAVRVIFGGQTFFNELEPCRSPDCLLVASVEYLNRLIVRPEAGLALIWTHRVYTALGLGLVILTLALLLRVWRWKNRRVLLFTLGWIGLSCLFFILSLWPYVADRFLYIPDMGVALLIGAAAHEIGEAWPSEGRLGRAVALFAALVGILWVLSGAAMLYARGILWEQAGRQARMILENTVQLIPDPPRNTTFVFEDVPDSYSPAIPPGNTGPYLFRNGLGSALRLRYGRQDLFVVQSKDLAPSSNQNRIFMSIVGEQVRLQGQPPD